MNRKRTRTVDYVFVAMLAIATSSAAAAVSDMRSVYDGARRLLDAGNPKAAIEELARQPLPRVPPSAPCWTISFSNVVVEAILIGRTHGYLLFEISRNEKTGSPLIVPAEDALIRDSAVEYDMRGVMTCVDLRTGQLLWTRMTPGRMKYAIDPGSDDLCLWRERLFVLDAKDGRVLLDVQGDRSWKYLDGVIRDDRAILQEVAFKECLRASRYPRVYDMSREAVRETDAFRGILTSPDGRKRITPPLQVREVSDAPSSLPEAPLLWKYDGSLSQNLPFWHGAHICSSSGNLYTKGVVRSLDGLTGKQRWSFSLPRGLCIPGSYQLRNGSYPPNSWNAVGPLGEHIVAIDGSGQMFFLDPSDGRVMARSSLVDRPLHFPMLFEGALVVSDPQRMRAVPLQDVLNPAAFGLKDVDLLRAEAMVRLGQAATVEQTVRGLVDQYPDWPRAWEILGDIYQSLNRPQEELAARCRFLSLTGQDAAPRLREAWGLLKRISVDEEEIVAPIALFDGKVYCGTKGGSLWAVDATTLESTRLGEYPGAFTQLTSTRQLSSNQGLIREERTVLERPVPTEEFKVFVERVRERTATDNIILSSAAGATLAFVRRHWPTATLEIWSRDGARQIRVEEIQRCPNEGSLLPLADGYLVTGDDLVWVPCDSKREVWLFGSRTVLPRAVPSAHYQGRVPNYDLPVLVDGRMFVGCRDGGLYVFEVERIAPATILH